MRILLACLLVLLAPSVRAQEVASTIDAVTVFERGAQIVRSAEARLPAGTTTLRFTGLTAALQPESVQLDGEGAFTLLSVVHRRDFLGEEAEPAPEIAVLRTELETLQDSANVLQAMQSVYREEESLLLTNKDLGGEQGVDAEALATMARLYRERLAEVKLLMLRTEGQLRRLRERMNRVAGQIREMEGGRRESTSTVEAVVLAERATTASFTLRYLAPAAAWRPHYDVRVSDVGAPVALTMNAHVQQDTGEDWNGVRLTLSSGDPRQGATAPVLTPWMLSFAPPRPAVPQAGKMSADLAQEEMRVDVRSASLPLPVQRLEAVTTTRFAIALPFTVPSDGKEHAVVVATHRVPAEYRYYAAPRAEPAAFLTARVADWEDYDLLPGRANLFLDGAYVGETMLDPFATADTLTLSLGRDESVVVERTKLRDFAERQSIGNRRSETLAFRIDVRNVKRRAVEIVVQDQVPVSQDERIDVRMQDRGGAEVDEATGVLTWRLRVLPGQTESRTFAYEVRYPKDRRVVLE